MKEDFKELDEAIAKYKEEKEKEEKTLCEIKSREKESLAVIQEFFDGIIERMIDVNITSIQANLTDSLSIYAKLLKEELHHPTDLSEGEGKSVPFCIGFMVDDKDYILYAYMRSLKMMENIPKSLLFKNFKKIKAEMITALKVDIEYATNSLKMTIKEQDELRESMNDSMQR
jgi:hypothetical protein